MLIQYFRRRRSGADDLVDAPVQHVLWMLWVGEGCRTDDSIVSKVNKLVAYTEELQYFQCTFDTVFAKVG